MSSQIFKNPVPLSVFTDFLDKNGQKQANKYIFSKTSFKKAQLEETVQPFLDSIKACYFPSKQFYVTRDATYKGIVTIIRQICKYHHVPFSSQIKYSQSKYEIIYTIFLPAQ
jgi:hypothetical protein